MNDFLTLVESLFSQFANFVWGMPLLLLLLGGGLFFMVYSRLLPYRNIGHGIEILTGIFDKPNDPGDLNHFQALSSALSGSLGLGNIAGVAIAISVGGPGAMFWMWATAVVGIATKFFTCTLSVMYRGKDSEGNIQGGPMYFIREGLGEKWHPLAVFFCCAALIGTLPVFQVNQLTQIVRDVIVNPNGWVGEEHFLFDLGFGISVAIVSALVIFGGIKRVGKVAGRLVPLMVITYLVLAIIVLVKNASEVPDALLMIFTEAFTGPALGGGLLGSILIGVRQGAFSNEAGIGTETMAHGAAKTKEPVREGLVGMLGPIIDTLIVCTCTGLIITITGVYKNTDLNGVSLTSQAISQTVGAIGPYILVVLVMFFSLSTVFTFWYYGAKSLNYMIGTRLKNAYIYFYLALIVFGSVASLDAMVGLISGGYGLMAIPTMTATFLLAPKVMQAARDYFARLDNK